MKKFLVLLTLTVLAATQAAGREKKTVEPFDRGIGTTGTVFIPSGTIGSGISFAYNNYSLGNGMDDTGYKMLFSLLQDTRASMMSFSVAPHISYFIRDNMSLGLRFDYGRTSLNVGNVNLTLTDDMSFSINDFNYLKQAYTGAVTFRNYIPFGTSKRFAMFAEIRGTGGYAQSQNYKYSGEDKFGTYQDIYEFEIGLVPGLCAFVTNEVALEVSVGLLGFNYQKVVQVTNQVERSESEQSGANFKINLFSIGFGLSFFIPTGGHRVKKAR